MKTILHTFMVSLALFISLNALAQFDPEKVCRLENGQLIFTLNLKWSEKEKKEVSTLFDLDSALIAQVYSSRTNIAFAGENWKVRKIKPGLVELYKPVTSASEQNLKINDIFPVIDKWMNFTGNIIESSVIYGVNSFVIPYIFNYTSDNARFYLPAFKTAGKVYLSGSFNGWSTSSTPMKAVSDGWMLDVSLKPGKYTYKYIVDGKWTTDPNNKLREKDGASGYNSVVYCYNHHFELKGYKNVRKVVVTGNFYQWNPRGIPLNKTSEGWTLPIYLKDGTYAYKYLVDGQWMADPGNPSIRKDGDGNLNSFIGIGESYLFKLDGFTNAEKVILTGSFNNWNRVELLMDKTDKGWQLPYIVAAGNYEYKFIVDGVWLTDLANPFSTGSGDTKNSFIALKANHLFELNKFQDAKNVTVTGSFNGWKKEGYRMVLQGRKWIFPLYLAPGKYTYKFVVDGEWILDPANDLFEQNEYNTNNSVLWVEMNLQ